MADVSKIPTITDVRCLFQHLHLSVIVKLSTCCRFVRQLVPEIPCHAIIISTNAAGNIVTMRKMRQNSTTYEVETGALETMLQDALYRPRTLQLKNCDSRIVNRLPLNFFHQTYRLVLHPHEADGGAFFPLIHPRLSSLYIENAHGRDPFLKLESVLRRCRKLQRIVIDFSLFRDPDLWVEKMGDFLCAPSNTVRHLTVSLRRMQHPLHFLRSTMPTLKPLVEQKNNLKCLSFLLPFPVNSFEGGGIVDHVVGVLSADAKVQLAPPHQNALHFHFTVTEKTRSLLFDYYN